MPDLDAFDSAYGQGVPKALGRGRPPTTEGRSRDLPLDAGAAPRDAAGAPTPTAFGGSVITGDGSLARGWVVVDGGRIAAVRSTKPRNVAQAIDTGGVILPGLIDLHGHPEYNVFAAWEPPTTYINRGRWRDSNEYAQLIKIPWATLTSGGKSASVKTAMTRYAEVRAAVGGVTAIQGASKDYPKKAEALVRNVDLLIFGSQVARSTVDFDRLQPDDVESIRKGIFDSHTVKAHYVHLAEGQKTNPTSVNEFATFAASPLFSPATVVIHGTALTRTHFDQLAAVGGSLVWSPQSNLRLYNETTDIAAAVAAGLKVGLGADWTPSGSPSLLHEMKVAWQVIQQTQTPIDPSDLVAMVTRNAAAIAGLSDQIGTLQVGHAADLTIVQKRLDDPYDNVVAAYPSWIELVVIGGDIVYGRPDWVAKLSSPNDYEAVTAWGRPMLLDTRFGSPDDAGVDGPPRRLAQIRAKLVGRYPAVAPIFA